jgi:hypothetical protein
MSSRRLLVTYAITGAVISVPFTILHLLANPDDTPITAIQHVTAAAANLFGPWGVAIVRLVDFPNAGLRSFSWGLAAGLTLVGALLVMLAARITERRVRWLLTGAWVLFALIWFGVGLTQIADGLL